MACPFFQPAEPLDSSRWEIVPRYPLGRAYSGTCAANRGHFPGATHIHDLCNYGYARGRCEAFPPSARADAVRFSFDPAQNQLVWILEADHRPVEHGRLAWDEPLSDPVLEAQRRAFLESTTPCACT